MLFGCASSIERYIAKMLIPMVCAVSVVGVYGNGWKMGMARGKNQEHIPGGQLEQ